MWGGGGSPTFIRGGGDNFSSLQKGGGGGDNFSPPPLVTPKNNHVSIYNLLTYNLHTIHLFEFHEKSTDLNDSTYICSWNHLWICQNFSMSFEIFHLWFVNKIRVLLKRTKKLWFGSTTRKTEFRSLWLSHWSKIHPAQPVYGVFCFQKVSNIHMKFSRQNSFTNSLNVFRFPEKSWIEDKQKNFFNVFGLLRSSDPKT